MSFVPKDVVLLPESTPAHPDRWVAMNVFARTALGLSGEVVALLGAISRGDAAPAGDRTFRCWDIECFSNADGLLADPSRYQRDPAKWRELDLDYAALVAKLKTHCILIDDEAAYRARFQPKKNLLDRQNFGDFHQQHGQHLMLVKRANPAEWWMQQKFSADYLSVRPDTLYGAVQWCFLKDFFAARIKPGMTVIDLGCGTGIYANAMAAHGATVIGIDPSEEYLAVARANAVEGTRFEAMNIGEAGGLDAIPDASADMVFMSDALLFYYRPFYPGQKADIQVVLRDIRRILKPGGVFISLEPHAAFYLTPWLGAADRPFTVVSEYLHKWYGIVPPLSWMIQAFSEAGLAVADMQEIGPADYFADIDPRGYNFATEFPLWQLLELKVLT